MKMAKCYNATEYMYSSARIRAMETRIASKEQLSRMAEAHSSENILFQLSDFGFEAVYCHGKLSREDTLMSVLKTAFEELSRMECANAVEFLKYQYDCNNIKALIKCGARGISAEEMLLELGSVSVADAKAAFNSKDYSVFPRNMAEAIPRAEEAFAATANPQKIDFIIDKATFADMLCSAEESGVPFARELATAKIDLVNITITARLIRMRLGAQAGALLDEVYIEGGGLEKEALAEALAAGETALADMLEHGSYSSMAALIGGGASLGAVEKKADDIWIGIASKARYIPFGAEVAIGYMCALEYEVKNIRIILAGKDAGLSADTIRERLRECYA